MVLITLLKTIALIVVHTLSLRMTLCSSLSISPLSLYLYVRFLTLFLALPRSLHIYLSLPHFLYLSLFLSSSLALSLFCL